MAVPNYSKAKLDAQNLLVELGYTDPPVSPLDIAKTLGLEIRQAKMPDKYSEVAGFLDLEDKAIYVNKADAYNRQTFTIAHEIAHFIMHKEIITEDPSKYKILYRNTLYSQQDPLEKEANCFAANLLVPESMFEKYKEFPASLLSTLFQVSQEVIQYRRKDIWAGKQKRV